MFHSIDRSKKPQKAKLYLAKPNKTIVGILTDAFNISYNPKLGNISELTFSILPEIDSHHQKVRNPSMDLIRDSYFLKYVCGSKKEWFIINEPKKSMSDSGDVLNFHAFSIPHELIHRNVRSYTVEAKNANDVLSDILVKTGWKIGYIAPTLNAMYLNFTIDNKTILEFITTDIANAFNAIVVWDTENRTVSLYKQGEYGNNKGLRVGYGKLLRGVEVSVDADQMCTRFRPQGQNGLTINSVNPTGQDYIDDFSYFISGFSQDTDGNVLSHSPWMSDNLCKALIKWQALIDSNKGVYSSLLSQLQIAQEELTSKNNELDNLKVQLRIISDNLIVAQQDGEDTTNLLTQQTSQQTLVNSKNAEIVLVNENIASIQTQIINFQSFISMENNLTEEELDELYTGSYIREKDWSNDFYWKAQDLYDAALVEFTKTRTPIISVTLDVVNFLSILEEQRNWDRLNLGDTVYIYYDKLNIDIKATITEFIINHQDDSISLTVSNTQNRLNDDQKFAQAYMQMVSSSNTVQTNSSNIRNIPQVQQAVTDLQTQPINASVTPIIAGVNNSVTVNDKGVTTRNPDNLDEFIQMNYKSIIITKDGGKTIKLAITPDGINSEILQGKLIIGENLYVQSPDGKVQLLPSGLVVFNQDGTTKMVKIGDISLNQDGSLYGINVFNENGDVVFSNNAAIQSYSFCYADNVANGFPLKIKFYIPPETIEIKNVKLAFSLEAFRTYETATASGGTSTSESSGTTSSDSSGDHKHLMFQVALESIPPGGLVNSFLQSASGDVEIHGVSASISDFGNLYTRGSSGNHYHSIPPHAHSIQPHTHPIEYGIYTGGQPSNIDVRVNGVTRLTNSGSHYNSDQSDLELAQWIQSGWNSIELTSTSLGRLAASVYIKSYISY